MLKQQGTRKTRDIRKKQTNFQGNFLGLGHFLRLKDSISLPGTAAGDVSFAGKITWSSRTLSAVNYLSVNWLIAHLS